MNRSTRIVIPLVVVLAFLLGSALRVLSRSSTAEGEARPLESASSTSRTRQLPTVSQPETEAPAAPVAEAPDDGERPVALQPQYHPRPADQWQGMLVDVATPQWCERTEQCGLALSCRSGKCLPCQQAGDCNSGEDCVLDHCVKRDLIECRANTDCGQASGKKVCILSGYVAAPRGNEGMRAYCVDTASGTDQTYAEWLARQTPAASQPNAPPRPMTTEDDLLQRL